MCWFPPSGTIQREFYSHARGSSYRYWKVGCSRTNSLNGGFEQDPGNPPKENDPSADGSSLKTGPRTFFWGRTEPLKSIFGQYSNADESGRLGRSQFGIWTEDLGRIALEDNIKWLLRASSQPRCRAFDDDNHTATGRRHLVGWFVPTLCRQ